MYPFWRVNQRRAVPATQSSAGYKATQQQLSSHFHSMPQKHVRPSQEVLRQEPPSSPASPPTPPLAPCPLEELPLHAQNLK